MLLWLLRRRATSIPTSHVYMEPFGAPPTAVRGPRLRPMMTPSSSGMFNPTRPLMEGPSRTDFGG
eukprot:811944-Pyramimonas_sp.AAC.1